MPAPSPPSPPPPPSHPAPASGAPDAAPTALDTAGLPLDADEAVGPGLAAALTPEGSDPYLFLLTTPLRALVRRAPVMLPPTASILEAARKMRDERVSSLLLIERDHLFGIVTDRDLRNRAVAEALDLSRPVLEVATVAPVTVQVDRPAFDAMQLMARLNVHHVPLLDGTQVAGMITSTDLAEQHSSSAMSIAGQIHRQTDVAGLAAAADKVKTLQRALAAADATAYSTGHIVTAIGDAVTVRLLQLAEMTFGPPPVEYAWIAAGSQARHEQTVRSDQDNGLVLDDAYDEAAHGDYFRALAGFVNDGLDACGYVYCPGEMMARTDAWRQPRKRWREYFLEWTARPEPQALMLTCVFFDLRSVYGRESLVEDLRADLLRATRGNGVFLANLVGNALAHKPPLSMFGGFSTTRRGERRDTVDLKHGGIAPIVALARVFALATGQPALNSHDRLQQAAGSSEISEQTSHDLRDALESLSVTRIRHQAAQMARGETPDNHLSISELSGFEQRRLKDAFSVVQTMHRLLEMRYH